MKSLSDLTRGIAHLVDILIGRASSVESDVLSQQRRVSDLEKVRDPTLHSMEVTQHENREREDSRRDNLSNNELRDELTTKYGTTKWARDLIKSIMFGRRNKNEPQL